MNAWIWLAVHDAAAIAAGAYLVSHDCPWWGLLCFVMAITATVTNIKKTV